MLPLGLTAEALDAATREPDPTSLAASVRLRNRFGPELAATAATQAVLRRRAATKFGSAAANLFFTRDGLEQATRPTVAAHHAARLVAAGARRVVDLGCGIGTDAMAFLRAGLAVVAVDRDPETAAVARANLATVGGSYEVREGAAEDLWPGLASADTAVFCDPARRNSRGRSWRVEDLSPGWPFVLELLAGPHPVAVKLGPGLPHRIVPTDVEAEWISDRGDTVEVALWSGSGSVVGRWSALLSEVGERLVAERVAAPPVDRPRRYLYEPLGAVVRSGGLAALAAELDAAVLHEEIAYLTTDEPVRTPFAVGFTVEQSFPYREGALRAWAREHGVGQLEILTRGLGLDPAGLRRRLRLRGERAATVVLTRTAEGPRALAVSRGLAGTHSH